MTIAHRKFNDILTVVIVVLGLYIAIAPFIPQLTYAIRDRSPEANAPYSGELADSQDSDGDNPIPQDNRIVIPSISIDEPILEGQYINTIRDGGTWRRPNSANPTEVDNTVIVGHRFYGSDTSTFYHLDKVSVGDKLALYWEGEEILYEIQEVKVVPANALEIEAPSNEKKLTIYTCTPIWTATDRLVVIAKPITLEES